jgi:hypothetical protein
MYKLIEAGRGGVVCWDGSVTVNYVAVELVSSEYRYVVQSSPINEL